MQQREQQFEEIASRLDHEARAGGRSGSEIVPKIRTERCPGAPGRLPRSPLQPTLVRISETHTDFCIVCRVFCAVCISICLYFNLLPLHPRLRSACEGCQRRFSHAAAVKGAGKTDGSVRRLSEISTAPRVRRRRTPPAAQRTDKDDHRSARGLKRSQGRRLENANLSLRRVTRIQIFSGASGRI